MPRTLIVVSCIAVLLAFASSGVVADNMSSSTMKSKPGSMDWLVGTWACTAKMNAMPNGHEHTHTYTLTFAPALNGAWMMQTYTGNRLFFGASFWLIDRATKKLVSVGVDSFGGYGTETSNGMGGGNTMTMAGTMYYGGHPSQAQDILTKISATQIRHVGKYTMKGTWNKSLDTTCTKNT